MWVIMIGVFVLTKMEKHLINAVNWQSMNPDFKKIIENNGKILWAEILEKVDYDEIIYKLTLKFLRHDGYGIGNNKIPEVKKS
jgi:hypothetical protein